MLYNIVNFWEKSMGKASMCIQLLELLNTGRIYKINELADILETNPRNIIEYKKELEEAGYYINSIPGRYGGYRLNKNVVIPSLRLLPEEKESIIDGFNLLMSESGFLKKDVYSRAFGKISSSIELPDKERGLLSADAYKLFMTEAELKERYSLVEQAIKNKNVIEIEYESIKNGLKKHVLHPYRLVIYNHAWFFLAFNPEVGEIWYFKLNRIAKINILSATFKVWKGFKYEDYFDGDGFKKTNEEYMHVVLKAEGIRKQLLKERLYGKNQRITENDDGSVIIEMDMQNEQQIISFVLSCGSNVKVLEPAKLIYGIKNELAKIEAIYKEEINE